MALNFKLVVSDQLFAVVLVAYNLFKIQRHQPSCGVNVTFEYEANHRTLCEGLWLWTLWTRWTIRFVSRPLTARWSVFNFMPNRLVMSWPSGAVAMPVMEFQVC